MRAQLNPANKIEVLEHIVSEFHEHIPLTMVKIESPEQKPSPNVTKGKKAAAQQKAAKAPPVPKTVVGDWGVSTAIQQFLEVHENILAFYV